MKKENEIEILKTMISLYCRKNHSGKEELCLQCKELSEYSSKRLELCHWGSNKPFCSRCPTQCYKADMKQKIKEVMRFSAPRMILFHPLTTTRHAFSFLRKNTKKG